MSQPSQRRRQKIGWLKAHVALLATMSVASFTSCNSLPQTEAHTQAVARFFLESDEGTATAILPKSGVSVVINPRAILTEDDIVGAEHAHVDLGDCLMLRLTTAAARDLYRLSVVNQGRRLVLMVNEVPIGARRIDGPLADGTIFIFTEIADAELPRLVNDLKSTAADVQREREKKS